MKKLLDGKPVVHLSHPGAEKQLELLSGLLTDATPGPVHDTLQAIGQLPAAIPAWGLARTCSKRCALWRSAAI